ncbi:Gfo/Idh/MocA family protein [Actinomadura decatromicini]|uniref:Oxidoreductase n=1 Tax=Actinomadura decatromicini TaxID=2604572 RepID=A0A5D3FVS0_9ACTN|nr:Gfo/Idh/MocA family oxidoreductase [Actinomadura decatromicini]TYK52401.1 oxidoreductase [Actinomadura decatromicini]
MSDLPIPFRLALVGAGRMGRQHLAALATSRTVEITDIVEPEPATRRALPDDGRRVHASLPDLLAHRLPDGIVVAAPTDEHAGLTRTAVAAGVPVLCEKPAGRSAREVDELAAFAAAHRVPVQVGYWRRHLPVLAALRERMRTAALGSIYLVTAAQWDGEPPAAVFRATSGGIHLDMGVHEFDQIRWLTGEEVVDVHAAVAGHVEDPAAATAGDVDGAVVTLRLSGGTLGTVSLGRYFPGGDMVRAEVFGSRGYERHDLLDPVDPGRVFHDALRRQADAFADLVRTGRRSGASLLDAARAVEIAERAAAAVRTAGPLTANR